MGLKRWSSSPSAAAGGPIAPMRLEKPEALPEAGGGVPRAHERRAEGTYRGLAADLVTCPPEASSCVPGISA